MTDAPGYRETTTEQRNEWLSRLGIISTHGKFEMLCRDLGRAEAELATATARAEQAEAERDWLAKQCGELATQNNASALTADWWLMQASQEAAMQGNDKL